MRYSERPDQPHRQWSRLLVVSHPAVLAVNQLPYAELREHGWDPWLVVPARWRHEYAPDDFPPDQIPSLTGRLSRRRIVLPGRVQRHCYLTDIATVIAKVRPAVAFIEEEPTAIPTLQWGRALHRARVPFGVQADENLPRTYPVPARAIRRWCTGKASFVAARSPAAAALLKASAPLLPAPLVPHHVPTWDVPQPYTGTRPFTVGYAGRLVPEKGLDDLLNAVIGIPGARARFVGNGPLLGHFRQRARAGAPVTIVTDAGHDGMAAAYRGFDVLVLPSRTTPTWAEQFGRVLVEALWCGVPVVGSSSGEIPWVVETTGGGVVFPEGDVDGLRRTLVGLRDDPVRRRRLASIGHAAVNDHFSVAAVARALDAALHSAIVSNLR